MAEPAAAAEAGRLRLAVAAVAGVVLLRSCVLVFCEGADFDSDQAIFGLMAKHLAELRAFPLYMYGQRYILAVSAWLAAPAVALLGPTVAAVKLPILAMNLVVAGLLVCRLVREAGLGPWPAVAATLPFALPPVPVAAMLTQNPGGNVEPLLWILLLWVLRERPWLFGLVAGFGFLNREFTIYGPLAVAAVQAVRGEIPGRPALARWTKAAAVFAAVLLAVHLLQPLSANPATRTAGIEWQGARSAALRAVALFRDMLPALFGLAPALLASTAAAVSAAVGLRLGALAWRARPLPRWADFPVYLVLVGAQCLGAYVLVGIGLGNLAYLRYLLIALLLPAGAAAIYLRLEPWAPARRAVVAALVLLAGWNGRDHVRLGVQYATAPPANPFRVLADDLVSRGVRYGAADYWIAYHASYLSGERVKLDARGFSRVSEYRRLFRENLGEAVDVRNGVAGCPGRTVAGQFCVVGPPAPLKRRLAPAPPAPGAP